MDINKNHHFVYDGIFFLDEKVDNYYEELKLIKSSNLKYLILLLDDRNYSLKEKNVIKAHLDNLQLDVLMFTLKPEYLNVINKKIKDFKILRSIARLTWILYFLDKYNIKNVYLNIEIIKNLNFVYKDNLDLSHQLKELIKKKNSKNILNKSFLNLINFINYKKINDKFFFFFK